MYIEYDKVTGKRNYINNLRNVILKNFSKVDLFSLSLSFLQSFENPRGIAAP